MSQIHICIYICIYIGLCICIYMKTQNRRIESPSGIPMLRSCNVTVIDVYTNAHRNIWRPSYDDTHLQQGKQNIYSWQYFYSCQIKLLTCDKFELPFTRFITGAGQSGLLCGSVARQYLHISIQNHQLKLSSVIPNLKQLNKQLCDWWVETPWRSCEGDAILMFETYFTKTLWVCTGIAQMSERLYRNYIYIYIYIYIDILFYCWWWW